MGGPTKTRRASRLGTGMSKCRSTSSAQFKMPGPESVRVPSRSKKISVMNIPPKICTEQIFYLILQKIARGKSGIFLEMLF
jgi:hypothetical protein